MQEHSSSGRSLELLGSFHNTVKLIMRSDQRDQQFLSFRGKEGIVHDDILETTKKLLMKDEGIEWNSTYFLLRRAVELKGAMEKLYKCQIIPFNERDERYWMREDKTKPEDWNEVLRYLSVLNEFVDATKYLEGNAEDGEYAETRSALWEVFL